MEEEPFEGDHWDGIFSKPSSGTILHDLSPSLSPSELDSVPDEDLSDSSLSEELITEHSSSPKTLHHAVNGMPSHSEYFRGSSLESREAIESLRSKQNWRPEWRSDADWNRPFNIADPSTLAAAADRTLGQRLTGNGGVVKV
jgi:gamma-tubulin complex component 5